MIPKLIKLLILLFFLQVFLPSHVVLADTGPKPTMEFVFNQELTGSHSGSLQGFYMSVTNPIAMTPRR